MNDKHLKILETLLLGIKDKIAEACKELQKIRYLPEEEKPAEQQEEKQEHFNFPTEEEAAEDEKDSDIPF